MEGRFGDRGSTCTMSSQVCTIDLISVVLPTPVTKYKYDEV